MKAAGPERSFFYASGRASNEAGFLFQMLARLFGTNYVNNCSYYCHQASGVGLGMAIGTGAGTVRLEDLEHTDLYILIGANPSSNHPRLMRSLMEIRRRGGQDHRRQSAEGTGAGEFSSSERCSQLAVRDSDRQPVRAASYRRRPGAADRCCQRRASNATDTIRILSQNTRKASRSS